jgi:predicted TIM-barrel fold metal-dependent hydrolase
MRIIDTHLHLIYPDQLCYPWLSNTLALNKAYSLDNY